VAPGAPPACFRSFSEPTVIAACETNGPPISSERSPTSNSDTAPSTRMAPCRNSVGPSTAIAPPMVTIRVPRSTITAMRAATMATSARLSWMALRDRRGVVTSTSTPTHAAPNRISIGSSAP
jgi:hypothetical protein